MNNYFKILLDEAGKNFDPTNEQAIMKAIKESQCYVAQDYWAEIESSSDKDVQYTLPDGSEITIPGKARMQCPELLFRPNLDKKVCMSVQDMVVRSITKSNPDFRSDLYKNVVLAGGSSMFEGFPDRLNKELTDKTDDEVGIVSEPDRNYSVFKGASMFASLSTFDG